MVYNTSSKITTQELREMRSNVVYSVPTYSKSLTLHRFCSCPRISNPVLLRIQPYSLLLKKGFVSF